MQEDKQGWLLQYSVTEVVNKSYLELQYFYWKS